MPYPKHSPNGRHDPRTTFTTLSGVDIHFVPFSWDEYQLALEGLKDEWRERGEIIDCPQYEVKLASGEIQKFDHNENTINELPPDTPEDQKETVLKEQKDLWERYQDASARFQGQDGEIMSEFIYADSLASITLPDDTAWEDKQRQRHIKIPDELEDKRRHYINTVLLKSKADQLDLVATITAVSMGVVKEADVERVRDSFRDRVYGNLSQTLRDTALPPEVSQEGQLESE